MNCLVLVISVINASAVGSLKTYHETYISNKRDLPDFSITAIRNKKADS